MTKTFNGARVWGAMQRRIVSELNAVADEAAPIAVQKAPVRKVMPRGLGTATAQSGTEAAAESAMRRTLGLGAGPVKTQRTAASKRHSIMSLRELSGSGTLKTGIPLTVRGRYELKSGRANFTTGGTTTLGGRLRGEIHVEPARGGGSVWTARVVSPTRYAKYVEFGTRHSRAQPYLRPALAQVRESLRTRMKAAVGPGRAA